MSFMGGGTSLIPYGGAGDPGGAGGGMGPVESSSGGGLLDGLFGGGSSGGSGLSGILGAGLKVLGPLLSGFGQKNAANANAETSRLMAESVRAEAEERARMRLRESARIAAQGRANFAKAGVEVDEGTPLLVELASREAGEADAKAIRETAAAKGRFYDAQGRQERQKGSNAMIGGLIDAGSSFMSSGAGKGLLS